MKKPTALLLLAALMISCGSEEKAVEVVEDMPGPTEAGPTLTAEELAHALNVTWGEYSLPGDQSDRYSLEAVIEYGDGRKAQRTGSMSPARGGSKAKFLVWADDETLRYTILAEGWLPDPVEEGVTSDRSYIRSSSRFMDNPFTGKTMTLGGQLKTDNYLIRGTSGNSSLHSHVPLKENEFGVRLVVKPLPDPEDAAETASN